MSSEIKQAGSERKVALLLAEFSRSADVLHAAEKIREAGYTRWDTHTPFPIHGMDEAMGLRDSRLGWIVIACALTGLFGAFTMMYWMGADYPLNIGGKPSDAIPPMMPIMFELTILLSAFGAVFGMLYLNRLPRHHHPIFESDRFRAASDDRFFLSLEAADPRFDLEASRSLLERLHATFVEVVEEPAS